VEVEVEEVERRSTVINENQAEEKESWVFFARRQKTLVPFQPQRYVQRLYF
jgi:hypothetical protein